MLDLTGKVAFVTGAGSGIGKGIALAFARQGADLALNDVVAGRAEETAAEAQALGRRTVTAVLDVRDKEATERVLAEAVAALARLDIVVANAGIARGGSILTMSEDDYDTQMDVNAKGVFITVQAGARELVREGHGGRIIVISSVAAERPNAGAWAYCASKAAVRMMTRCWAQDLSPFRITVNSIGPGFIDTPLGAPAVGEGDIRALNERYIPMGRIGMPADIGALAVWLASDEAEYITSTYNVMDGGLVDAGAWGMQTGEPSMRDALLEMTRTMSGGQILDTIDTMTAQALGDFARLRAERGLQ